MNRFTVGATIVADNPMQQDFRYVLNAPMGENFNDNFDPELSPKQMLHLGVFEGYYLNSCRGEYPDDWFEDAALSDKPDISVNFFKIKSRQPLNHWQQKGWIYGPDPRGWFEWYCRYYLGRRLPTIDAIQIKRWRAFRRHLAQVKQNCLPMDCKCRPRQRQALLQWAYDPFI